MKHIPIAFPLLFLLIIVTTFFAGAYAVAEGAIAAPVAAAPAGDSSERPASLDHLEWYESAAVWVCPLH
jgi:hypothetical protein